ncbi:MAG: glycosyltransferase family 4 protein [Candidatus Omnitrophota bacterium]|nr:MAG: glycosyltransferase family 4 protein [Candidatus Omnitrophota bacterium]
MDRSSITQNRASVDRMDLKHILIINRSFWPDIEATGQFLTELCEHLVKKYRVTVIAGRSYYVKKDIFEPAAFYGKEKLKGVEILRARHTVFWKGSLIGRLLNWFTYGILTFFIALRTKPDVVIACTDPPFLGILALIVSRIKSVPFIYNCRDVYPDVVLELGHLKPNLLSAFFDSLNKKAFKRASYVVCLGHSMESRLKAKGVFSERIKVISDWTDVSVIQPVPKEENPFLESVGLKKENFTIMYSGNLGFSHNFHSILHSLALMQERFLFHLIFIGEGVGKTKLMRDAQRFGLKNILFLPYQTKENLRFSLSAGDLHLVPLGKGLAGASVPSKTYGIMAAGRPYLALTDRESEPAYLAEEFGCGLWVSPDNIKAITQTIEWAFGHQDKLKEMGRVARRIAETQFDKSVVIDQWHKILDAFGDFQKNY